MWISAASFPDRARARRCLEVFHLKMLVQFLAVGLFIEHPFVVFEGEMLCSEEAFEVCLLASFI